MQITQAWSDKVLVLDSDVVPPLFELPASSVSFVQATWAGIDPIINFLENDPCAPKDSPSLKLCRLAHPIFSQLMAEYLVGAGINHARSVHQGSLYHKAPIKSQG